MATSNLLAPIFRWASWWLADDIFIWIQWSFYSSKNLDTRWIFQWVSLSKALVLDTWAVVEEWINSIIKILWWDILAFGSNGGIYRKSGSSWAKVATNTPASAILSANEFNWYVYWTQATKMHRIKTSDVSNDIKSKESLNFKTLQNSEYHPLLVSMWSMFVWNGDKFDEVDIDDVYDELTIIEKGSTIKHLWDMWWVVRAITVSSLWHNNIYLIQKSDKFPEQNIPFVWAGIKQSIIFNWYNYITTNWGLTILDWYKLYPIKEIDVFNTNVNAIWIHKDKLHIWGKWWVYTWGQKNKNYPESLALEYLTSNWKDDDEITCIYGDWVNLYVAWKNWTDYWIDVLSDNTYWTKWEIITRWYYAHNLHSVKESISISYGFQKLKENEKITIYYSIDWWDFKEVIEITDDSKWITNFTDDSLFWEMFQYLQIKLVLEWDWTTTPVFYSADLLFNDNIRR